MEYSHDIPGRPLDLALAGLHPPLKPLLAVIPDL